MHNPIPPKTSVVSHALQDRLLAGQAERERVVICQATEAVFADLERLALSPEDASILEIPGTDLCLRRTWPLASGALALEYLAASGGPIPGQVFSSTETFTQALKHTRRAVNQRTRATVHPLPQRRLFLQMHGADRRLPGLAPLLAIPGAELVVHRPERRAVVRLVREGAIRYAKVTRPRKIGELVRRTRAARRLFRGKWHTPDVVAVDEAAGVMELSALPGRSLHELADSPRFPEAARLAGEALRALHSLAPPDSALLHDAAAEIGVLARWLTRLGLFGPEVQALFQRHQQRVAAALVAGESPPVLLHRDFYDKQLVLAEDGRLGLLDFDTLGVGEAALDVANALVHMELRRLQGKLSPARTADAQAALLAGYRPSRDMMGRLDAYADATRLRLACVYTFRPQARALVPRLLARIGAEVV